MGFLDAIFAHPAWLAGLILPAAGAVAYWLSTRNRAKRAIAFGNFAIVGKLASGARSWMSHLAVVLALLSLTLVIIGLAGPISETKVARNRATVMMVVDVSLSMSATDVSPDRITAAKEAGREFVEKLPDNLNIGLVTFSGRAQIPVTPTTDHDTVIRALDGAELDQATATGDAIASALDSIKQFTESVRGGADGTPPATIVLLSDGKQTVPQELDDPRGAYTAADKAAKAGIPISTISFGTQDGAIIVQGEQIPVPNDDESLREIARKTKGNFYSADSLEKLRDAYSDLEDDIGYELKRAENPRPFLIAAFITLTATIAAHLVASRRIPE
nr:VWA domain-containing protein [Corynebacterium lactis]